MSFWLRGGYSHLIGYFGAELVIGYIGVECGYAPNRGTVETTSAIGIAASYFFNGSYKRGLYTSIGYMHNGYKKETYDGILPEVEWRGRFSGIVGYRIAWWKFDIRGGAGYGIAGDYGNVIVDFTIGVNLIGNNRNN